MDTRYLNKFYKKSFAAKVEALKDAEAISKNDYDRLSNQSLNLPFNVASRMIENHIANYELPFGVAMNFVINDEELLIPMVTEEPSVIAAASNAGKMIAKQGGFQTKMKERLLIGQVALKNVPDIDKAKTAVKENEEHILDLANAAHPSILNYNGGARTVNVRTLPAEDTQRTPDFFVVHLAVDTGEAMGANIVNTMVEAIGPFIEELTEGDSLMNILSNYATDSLVTATCTIDPQSLQTKELDGDTVRDRIIEATQLAQVDPYRAVTHNKGIMNGLDSVLVATGNDWRAVEASAHAYASKSGQYRSLSTWTKDDNGNLKGSITLPISVGAVGGTLSIHPTAQFAYRLLDEPNAKELSGILASVGLAQNLSAVRALVTEGIQKGHMGLQARSLAVRIGAKGKDVDRVAKRLQTAEYMNSETAKDILNNLDAEKNTD